MGREIVIVLVAQEVGMSILGAHCRLLFVLLLRLDLKFLVVAMFPLPEEAFWLEKLTLLRGADCHQS